MLIQKLISHIATWYRIIIGWNITKVSWFQIFSTPDWKKWTMVVKNFPSWLLKRSAPVDNRHHDSRREVSSRCCRTCNLISCQLVTWCLFVAFSGILFLFCCSWMGHAFLLLLHLLLIWEDFPFQHCFCISGFFRALHFWKFGRCRLKDPSFWAHAELRWNVPEFVVFSELNLKTMRQLMYSNATG